MFKQKKINENVGKRFEEIWGSVTFVHKLIADSAETNAKVVIELRRRCEDLEERVRQEQYWRRELEARQRTMHQQLALLVDTLGYRYDPPSKTDARYVKVKKS